MSFCLPNLGHSVALALSHSLSLSLALCLSRSLPLSLRLSNKFTSGGLFLLSTTTVAFTTQRTATESSSYRKQRAYYK